MRDFLETQAFGTQDQRDAFSAQVAGAFEGYLALTAIPVERAEIKKRYRKVAVASEKLAECLLDLLPGEHAWLSYLAGSKGGAALSGLEENSFLAVLLTAKREDVYLALIRMQVASEICLQALSKTKQDSTRPLRFLVQRLLRGWEAAGLKRQAQRRDAVPGEIGAADPDVFTATVALICAGIPPNYRPTGSEIVYAIKEVLKDVSKANSGSPDNSRP